MTLKTNYEKIRYEKQHLQHNLEDALKQIQELNIKIVKLEQRLKNIEDNERIVCDMSNVDEWEGLV